MAHPLDQTAWRRGWNDTTAAWANWRFIVLEAVVAVVVGGIFGWYWGLGIVIFGMVCIWLGATARAPVWQRNEARRLLAETPSKRKAIAEQLARLCIQGIEAKKTILKDDFAGDAMVVCNDWIGSVITYFRTHPNELGNSKLLSLGPDYQDWVVFGPTSGLEKSQEIDYVHRHISIVLSKLKKLVEEFDSDKL